MAKRVSIVGTGWVGTSIASSALQAGVTDELWVHDARSQVAEGEALDLTDGAAFYPPCVIRPASLEAMCDSDVVVIAAGRGGRPGESRLALLRDNVALISDFAKTFASSRAVFVVVSNPVDVLTRVFKEVSGLPAERVLGTGTMLDTARLRQRIGRRLGLSTTSVHAQVVGEHGDSQIPLWSSAHVGGVALRDWPDWTPAVEASVAQATRDAAGEVISRKGATNHAIGLVTADLLKALLQGDNRVLPISRVQEGALGVRNVAISLPTIVTTGGGITVLEPSMDAVERASFAKSVEVMRASFDSLT